MLGREARTENGCQLKKNSKRTPTPIRTTMESTATNAIINPSKLLVKCNNNATMTTTKKDLFKNVAFFALITLLVIVYFLYCMFFDFSPVLLRAQNFFAEIITGGNNQEAEWPKRMSVPVRWPQPIILAWTGWFSNPFAKWLMNENDVTQCPFRCQYSDDKAFEANASVLVFHSRDTFTPLPSRRHSAQLYAFHTMESPHHTGPFYKGVPRDFFNITMTYRHDSDVPYPYDAFHPLEEGKTPADEMWSEEEVLEKIEGKSELALQIVSNCGTPSRRERYVDELKWHVNVTLMGACVHKGCDAECAAKLFDSHFFYLAFENSVCKDYATEKFWNIKKLIVPVVLTRSVFSVGLGVPNDTFIAADDFNSAEELAEHLKAVAANREMYMEYLQWTRHFKKSEHRKEKQLNPLCQLCKMAYEEPPRKHRVRDIVHFWETGGQCQDRFSENFLLNDTA